MAETQFIPSTSLQNASEPGAERLSLDVKGEKQGVNGAFDARLDESIQEASRTESGNRVPDDGKALPLNEVPLVLDELKNKLFSQTKKFNIDGLDSNLLETSTELLETSTEQLEDIVDSTLLGISQLSDISVDPETIGEVTLAQLTDIEDAVIASDAIDNITISVSTDIGKTTIQDTQHLDVLPVTAGINSGDVNQLTQPNLEVDDQVAPLLATASNDIEVQNNLLRGKSSVDNVARDVSAQDVSFEEDSSVEVDDFITKYLSGEGASKSSLKNQIIDLDIFQQNIGSLKAEPSAQNVNLGSAIDSYANISTGNTQNKLFETPIPLVVKQGVSSEQIQQNIDQSINQNVKWLIGNKVQNARINVFPESLGQVNIVLNLEDSNLKLNFTAANNVTKDIIDASIASLKTQLNESGINLQEVNVDTRSFDQANSNSEFSSFNSENELNSNQFANHPVDEHNIPAPHQVVAVSTLCLIDAYA